MRIFAVCPLILALLLTACSKDTTSTSTEAVVEPAAIAETTAPAAQPEIPAEEKPVADATDPHAGHDHAKPAAAAPIMETPPPANSAVSAESYIEGTHYEVLPEPVKTLTGDKIEVTEVFSYACIHCFHFEAVAKQWEASRMPADVEFVQNPAIFNKAWAYYARIYYTAKALKVLDPVHNQVFESIHVKGNRLGKLEDVAAIFAAAGVAEAQFKSTFESFGVSSQVQLADTRVSKGFKTKGTPELIIDGRYRVTTGMAGNHPNMFKVAEFLIAKIKQEKATN